LGERFHADDRREAVIAPGMTPITCSTPGPHFGLGAVFRPLDFIDNPAIGSGVIDAKLRPRSARTVRFGQVDDDRAPIPDSAQGLPAVGSLL
jgi:hypothetical protein